MRKATLKDYKRRILRVLLHIQQHLEDDLSVDYLAGIAAFSPYHFHRIFTGMVGESVKVHVRRLRLERAASQLKLSKHSVTRIAMDAGYNTHEAFTRAFRELFGTSPSRFRATGGQSSSSAPSGVHFSPDGTIGSFEPLHSGGRKMDVQILSQDPATVALVRHVGPYNRCGAAWEKLCTWAGPQGLLGAGTKFIGLCYDDPEITPPDKIRYDACITVEDGFKPEGEIGVQVLEGGEYAMTTHLGPYERLNETYWVLLGQWIPGHGRQVKSAPCLEVYLNDPDNTEPEDLITDVYAPLV